MPEMTYPEPIEGLTPGTIIITEETVETIDNNGFAYGVLYNQSVPTDFIPPMELEVLLNGKSYILKCVHNANNERRYFYGDISESLSSRPIFDNNPVVLQFVMNLFNCSGIWGLATPEPGTYTISAKIPGAAPKVLCFPKGRTIVSELSRLNKAFGTVSKKKTIIGQLSDIADAAESGKIGGGSGGALMVHIKNTGSNQIMDKTWNEIYDALKTSSVYVIGENEEELSVAVSERIVGALFNGELYNVQVQKNGSSVVELYKIDSPDGYPYRQELE